MLSPIQILKLTNEGLVFDKETLFNTLDKIGDKHLGIVSIIGKQKTGKSLLLNYFLRKLDSNLSNNDSVQTGFELIAGVETRPNGIYIWPQPYIGQSEDGSEVALFFLETRCDFDDKAKYHECGIIFAISLLLSSTIILNITNDLSEDIIEFIEEFTSFAQTMNDESKSELFQRLVFLIRDWDNECEYKFGYHDDSTPDENNYKKNIIIPNDTQRKEDQNMRIKLLSIFGHISCYLMPNPGKNVTKSGFCGQIDLIGRDFIEKAEEFMSIIIESLEPKIIGGHILTAISARIYFNKWQEFIINDKRDNRSVETNVELGLQHACNLFETKPITCIETNPTDKESLKNHIVVDEEDVKDNHCKVFWCC